MKPKSQILCVFQLLRNKSLFKGERMWHMQTMHDILIGCDNNVMLLSMEDLKELQEALIS